MIDQNWIRWIRASARIHFDNAKQGKPLLIDGENRNSIIGEDESAEFRIDGPDITKFNGEYRLDVEINLLVEIKQDKRDLDKLPKIAGIFQAAFTDVIPVYKHGDGPDDNPTELIGCLELDGKVSFNNFGVIDETNKMEQGTVDARYYIYL